MHASTRALEDDEAVSSRLGSGVAQPFSDEDRSDIVRIGPQAKYMGTGYPYPTGRDHPASNWVST